MSEKHLHKKLCGSFHFHINTLILNQSIKLYMKQINDLSIHITSYHYKSTITSISL